MIKQRTYKKRDTKLNNVTDVNIITNLMNEDSKTQKEFYKAHFGHIMGTCRRYLNNPDEALEACQDVFLKVFKNISKYDNKRDIKKWIGSIAINECIDRLRSKKKQFADQTVDYEEASNITYLNTEISEQLDAEIILKIINRLDEKYKTVFLLYVVDGYSHREIGDLLSISNNTSKWLLTEARKKLKPLIQKHYFDESESGKYY